MKKLLTPSKARSLAITSDRYFLVIVTDTVREEKFPNKRKVSKEVQ